MSVFDSFEFVEFVHSYETGEKVLKRGLTAASFVIKKYGIAPEEAVAFSSWQGRKKAMTVFHFHPDFPRDDMQAYMEGHLDGIDLINEVKAEWEQAESTDWFEQVRETGVWSEIAIAAVRSSGNMLGSTAKKLQSAFATGLTALRGRLAPQQVAPATPVAHPSLSLKSLARPEKAIFPLVLSSRPPQPMPSFKPAIPIEGRRELAMLAAKAAADAQGRQISTAIH